MVLLTQCCTIALRAQLSLIKSRGGSTRREEGLGREGITPRAEDADNAGRQDVTGAPRATDFKPAALTLISLRSNYPALSKAFIGLAVVRRFDLL